MKTLSLLLAWACPCALALAAEPARRPTLDGPTSITEELRVEQLADGAYLIVHLRPWPANSLLVEMADGTLVLCDTPYDDRATADLLAWLGEAFGERSIVAINGHFHPDALGGNNALLTAGIPSYGSDLTARMFAERGATLHAALLEMLPEDLVERYTDAEWLPPAKLFPAAEGLELRFGDERVVVYYPGPAHSPDNVVTWFPDRKLLFGGCLVRTVPRLGNIADADLESYPQTVDNLRRFAAETIVPGHGPVGGPELLDVTLQAVEALFRP